MRRAGGAGLEQLGEHGFSRGDAFDRVGAAEELIEEKEMRRGLFARAHQPEHGFHFGDVITLARLEVVAAADAGAHMVDRRAVRVRETGIERLRHDSRDADGAQERRLARHIRSGDEHTVRRTESDGIGDRVSQQRMADASEGGRRARLTQCRVRPPARAGARPDRCRRHRRVDLSHGRQHPKQAGTLGLELARCEKERVGIEQEQQIQILEH